MMLNAYTERTIFRANVVIAYLSCPFVSDEFVVKFNAGEISKKLLAVVGPIDTATLIRWTGTVAKVGEEA